MPQPSSLLKPSPKGRLFSEPQRYDYSEDRKKG